MQHGGVSINAVRVEYEDDNIDFDRKRSGAISMSNLMRDESFQAARK